jgi:hypothetical protein
MLEVVQVEQRTCLLATFTHPSTPSRDGNWGTDERRPYLNDVVAPTATAVREYTLRQPR